MNRLHLYRNISIVFIIFAAIILCAVFLMFYSQATIVISADRQKIDLNFNTEIKTSSTLANINRQDAIMGALVVTSTEVSAVFNASSTRSATADTSNIVGRVVIKNEGTQAQVLVKTTQLQAENGVIVRTNNDVKIPASGSVEVDVFAKDPDTFKEISGGRLTIIKLPVSLQSKIFGEPIGVIEKQLTTTGDVYYITESDINRAKQELIDKAVAIFSVDNQANLLKGELISFELDKKLGDVAKMFTMKATVKIRIIKPEPQQLISLIKEKAEKSDINGLLLDNIDLSQVKYLSADYANLESISVKIHYPLEAYLSENNPILSKNNFTDKTTQEIKDWATNSPVINSVETVISPYWREKTPKDSKRIKIIIQ